jgi:hypothetical protein
LAGKEPIGDFDFEVDVNDRRITAVHREYRHRYWSTWRTEPPYLAPLQYYEDQLADHAALGLVTDAEKAMLRKLQNDGLIS